MKAILRTAAAGVAIASFGIASAASAATNDEAQVTATILTALSVDVVPGDDTLDFGTIADGGIVGATDVVVGNDGVRGACPPPPLPLSSSAWLAVERTACTRD